MISLDIYAFGCKMFGAELAGVIYKKKGYRYNF